MTAPEEPPPAAPAPEPESSTAAAGEPAPTSHRRRRGTSFWRELPFLVVIALVLALLIKTFLVQAFYIPSGSMEPTLHGCPGCSGDRVLVNKLVYRFRDPHRGEIVVFRGPPSWQDSPEFQPVTPSNPVSRVFHDIGSALGLAPPSSKDFIKRVIGVGGDKVSCTGDQLFVNGVKLDEPYIAPGAHECSADNFEGQSITVPKDRLFVMGDNRDESADSRFHLQDGEYGTIPIGNVIGRAFVVVWPPSRWKTLGVPSTFQQAGLAAAGVVTNPLALGFIGAVPVTLARRRVRARRSSRPPAP